MTSESTGNFQMVVYATPVGNRAFNLSLDGSAVATIDAYSIWLADYRNGSVNQNVYFEQETNAINAGTVGLGHFLTSGDFCPARSPPTPPAVPAR